MSSRGRYPCFLYNFILGNWQQATVVFGQAKKCLDHTSSRPLLSLLDKRSYVSSFPKQKKVSDIVLCLISCSQLLSNISGTSALVPAADILSTTVQRHIINGRG